MKLAVIGSGPLAVEACSHFYDLGAEVTIFKSSDQWGGSLSRGNLSLLSDSLLEYLKRLQDLGKSFEEKGIVKNGKITRTWI